MCINLKSILYPVVKLIFCTTVWRWSLKNTSQSLDRSKLIFGSAIKPHKLKRLLKTTIIVHLLAYEVDQLIAAYTLLVRAASHQ